MIRPQTLGPAPETVGEYLDRCREEETFVAWWRQEHPKDPHEALWVITFTPRTRTFTVVSFPAVVHHWSHQLYGSSYDPSGMEHQLREGLWDAPDSAGEVVRGFLKTLGP